MSILAGDIGGTKTLLALFEAEHGELKIRHQQRYVSADYDHLSDIIEAFRKTYSAPVQQACFAIAGPVQQGRSKTTNLPWLVDAAQLAQILKLPRCGLINDLEATAWGIATLQSDEIASLHEGVAGSRGNACLIAAGTGLGEAGLYYDGSDYQPFASEGGHCDFSPSSELEIALLKHLQQQHEHVSWERLVSGMGLVNIVDFLINHNKTEVHASVDKQDAASISQAADSGICPLCKQALDMMVYLYGVEAGNLALKLMASGGVWLGGGIAPKILAHLQQGEFMRGFSRKGRMSELLESMPVRVILNQNTALNGAARYASIKT